ncbi:MAG: hypothetical protein IJ881_04200, partial [Neisseriaceae bacterium]|nr:hypothetical protein [Neisseriaceae bacterium]
VFACKEILVATFPLFAAINFSCIFAVQNGTPIFSKVKHLSKNKYEKIISYFFIDKPPPFMIELRTFL